MFKYSKSETIPVLKHIKTNSTSETIPVLKHIKTNSTSETIPVLKTYKNNTETFLNSDEEKAECLNEIHITVLDIEDTISTLDLNKAVGLDLISHKLIKHTGKSISKPLCIITISHVPVQMETVISSTLVQKGR